MTTGSLHHVELRVADLEAGRSSWGWLLTRLGYERYQHWSQGTSWRLGTTYVVIEAGGARTHDRRDAGLNHLAFHGGARADVDAIAAGATEGGWQLLYRDQHPWAGGAPSDTFAGHYAAYLENGERFKVEIVAEPER